MRTVLLLWTAGLSFPEDDMYGIDLVIPDITHLKDNIDKVKGFLSHTVMRTTSEQSLYV